MDGLVGDKVCFLDQAVPGITLQPAKARPTIAGQSSLRISTPIGARRLATFGASVQRFSLFIDSSPQRQ